MKKLGLILVFIGCFTTAALASDEVVVAHQIKKQGDISAIWEVVKVDGLHYLRVSLEPFIQANGDRDVAKRAAKTHLWRALLQSSTLPVVKDGKESWIGDISAAIRFAEGWAYTCLEGSTADEKPITIQKVVDWVNKP